MNLYDLAKWKTLGEKESITLTGTSARRLSVLVNAPYPTRVYRVVGKGELDFIAKVDGFEEIRFSTEGEVELVADNDGCKFYCGEWESTTVEIADAQSFVKMAERKQRNPELELMMRQMQANTERLLKFQADELGAQIAAQKAETDALKAKEPAPVPTPPATPEPAPAAPQADPAPVAPAPATPAPENGA